MGSVVGDACTGEFTIVCGGIDGCADKRRCVCACSGQRVLRSGRVCGRLKVVRIQTVVAASPDRAVICTHCGTARQPSQHVSAARVESSLQRATHHTRPHQTPRAGHNSRSRTSSGQSERTSIPAATSGECRDYQPARLFRSLLGEGQDNLGNGGVLHGSATPLLVIQLLTDWKKASAQLW